MKLQRFAWSHWIWKYLFYLEYKFYLRAQAAPDASQLPQTSPRKNGKPSIFWMAQKIELVIQLFSGLFYPFYVPLESTIGELRCIHIFIWTILTPHTKLYALIQIKLFFPVFDNHFNFHSKYDCKTYRTDIKTLEKNATKLSNFIESSIRPLSCGYSYR